MESDSNSKRKLDDLIEDNSSPTKKTLKTEDKREDIIEEVKQENIEDSNNCETKNETINVRATESDVGITEKICDLPGCNGVIKERYSDFLVNEIDPKENVVHLTNMDKPSEPELPNKSQASSPVRKRQSTTSKLLEKFHECQQAVIESNERIVESTDRLTASLERLNETLVTSTQMISRLTRLYFMALDEEN